MGQNTGKPTSLPNNSNMPMGGTVTNPLGGQVGSGGYPIGNNGQQYLPPAPNQQNTGNQQGGGSLSSMASTEGFNQFLQQFMQGGGMQQFMQPPPQWNPYMSLINPNGGSYKPPTVGNPTGYTPPPFNPYNPIKPGQPFVPGTSPITPPGGFPGTIGSTNPGGQTGPWWDPYNTGKPAVGNSNRVDPQGVYRPAGGLSASYEQQGTISDGMPGQRVVDTSSPQGMTPWTGTKPILLNDPNSVPGPTDINGMTITTPVLYGEEDYPGNVKPWTDLVLEDPTGGTGNPNGGGSQIGGGGGGGNVNAYGMPTGGTNLTNVPTQYTGAQYNPFSGQAPGMIGAQDGAWNDPAFMQKLQMGLGGMANLMDPGSADVYGKFATDTQNLMGRAAERNVADLRARYGMGGGSNLGSAAALAEGNFLAENNAQVGRALGEINIQERGLNMQQRGQDLQNYLGSRGLDINQLGMMSQNNQFGSDLNLRAGMSNQNSQQNWQQLLSNNNQFQNTFNQNDSQFGANYGQQGSYMNNQNNMQNQQQQNQYGLGVANIGMQQQAQQQQQQQFMMNQMMNAYMAQAGWNTPQAENVVKPSAAEQAAQWAAIAATIYGGYQNRNR